MNRRLFNQALHLELRLFEAWLRERDVERAARLRLAYNRAVWRCLRRMGC